MEGERETRCCLLPPPIPRHLGPIWLEGRSLWRNQMGGWSGSLRGTSISLTMEGIKFSAPPTPALHHNQKQRDTETERAQGCFLSCSNQALLNPACSHVPSFRIPWLVHGEKTLGPPRRADPWYVPAKEKLRCSIVQMVQNAPISLFWGELTGFFGNICLQWQKGRVIPRGGRFHSLPRG